jgi:hypothetical protein
MLTHGCDQRVTQAVVSCVMLAHGAFSHARIGGPDAVFPLVTYGRVVIVVYMQLTHIRRCMTFESEESLLSACMLHEGHGMTACKSVVFNWATALHPYTCMETLCTALQTSQRLITVAGFMTPLTAASIVSSVPCAAQACQTPTRLHVINQSGTQVLCGAMCCSSSRELRRSCSM